jgi:hypothetical protein
MISEKEEPPCISVMEFQRRLKLAKEQFAELNPLVKSPGRGKIVAELDENCVKSNR